MTAEAQPMPDADLVSIDVTTTSVHAELVLRAAVDELKARAAYLQGIQATDTAFEKFGMAVYINHQINHCLAAAVAAQELLRKFTTQGEEEHGNEV